MTFDERSFLLNRQQHIINDFLIDLKAQDKKLKATSLSKGWLLVKTAKRTVTFTFGTVTFSRNVFTDSIGNVHYPLDEALGLSPFIRYSKEVLFELTTLAAEMSYRKAAKYYSELKGIEITKDTVAKAVKYTESLYSERSEYRIIAKENSSLKKVKKLYIEGDGILVKSPLKKEQRNIEISHFVVHEGSLQVSESRKELKNKKEFLAQSVAEAKEHVLDYLHNNYDLTEETTVITNSDMGLGYSERSFRDMLDAYDVKHFHHWDRYHLNKRIKKVFDGELIVLRNRFFKSLNTRRKKEVTAIFDTCEAILNNGQKLDELLSFKEKVTKYFTATASPERRGYSSAGIGVVESNNAKIAFRMKHRGMYWGLNGAVTMARIIIDHHAGDLRELFFGNWRDQYLKIFGERIHRGKGKEKKSQIPTVNVLLKSKRYGRR